MGEGEGRKVEALENLRGNITRQITETNLRPFVMSNRAHSTETARRRTYAYTLRRIRLRTRLIADALYLSSGIREKRSVSVRPSAVRKR